MEIKQAVERWFKAWEEGDYLNLPVADNFKHTSPYGTIDGREVYLELVDANKEKFLNHRFVIHDTMYQKDKACVRYSAVQEDFELEVSEWFWMEGDMIREIVSYYNIPGEVREDRQIEDYR